jgi:menaquinone-9 beta-reductase
MGLSRRRLDGLMLERARTLGANVIQATASFAEGRVWLGNAEPIDCENLFLATGKHDMRGLPRSRDAAGNDPMMGLRLRVEPPAALRRKLAGHIEMHLFPGGYAGVVLQEDNTANICMAIRKSRLAASHGKPAVLLAALAEGNPYLAERLVDIPADPAFDAIGHVPYGWRATEGTGGVFRLGDQAGVIPSLAGEGIGIALASADEAVRFWRSRGGAGALPFQQRLSDRLRRPLAVAGIVARLGEGRQGAQLLTLLAGIPGAASLVAGVTRI